MTLRRKFILALVSMVVFMAIIFGSISLLSVDILLDRSISYIQQGYINQWTQFLVSYYEQHKNWDELQDHVIRIIEDPRQREWGLYRENIRGFVLDLDYSILAGIARPNIEHNSFFYRNKDYIKAKASPIQVNNETVGYLWIEDSFTSRTNFLYRTLSGSIIMAMVVGLTITSLCALVLGVLMTRRLTEPLRQLTQAVTSVGQGNLATRIEAEGSTTDLIALTEAFNQMTAKLSHNEEVRTKMVADIAHELRTPLTVISGKLESIQEGVYEANPETILPIQDEVIRMTRLVRDLQHLTLAEAGKLPLHIQEVDLEKLITQILEHFVIALEEKKISVKVTGRSVPVQGDSDRLMQVLVNLIDNGIRHCQVGGFFQMHFHTGSWDETYSEDGVFVEIHDSGEGIPEHELPRIFDRFYRVDSSRDRKSGGTGLGLAIAKEFIQAHKGNLTVTSIRGEGTTFTIWIPVTQS